MVRSCAIVHIFLFVRVELLSRHIDLLEAEAERRKSFFDSDSLVEATPPNVTGPPAVAQSQTPKTLLPPAKSLVGRQPLLTWYYLLLPSSFALMITL